MIEIRKKRTERGLTQRQVADSLGVEPNTVSQWESGAREPRVCQLPKLSEVLGCTIDELFDKDTPSGCSDSAVER